MITYRHHHNTYTKEGDFDEWTVVGEYPTLEAAYEAAKARITHFDIIRWVTTSRGAHGATLWGGWSDYIPPIEELQRRDQRAAEFERKFYRE